MNLALRQTGALFLDAYRELNAKKLFWITLALSGLIVAVFAGIGYGEQGISFFGWKLSFIPLNTELMSREAFYKSLFSNLGIGVWLSWVATILALVSTAGFIPDMISGGAIETLLSKPIGRTRLFLTKFLTGLLFVALQVAVFSLGSFLIFGLRAQIWAPGIFLAVPIVVVFYSYLFAVCALVGLLTRSTITSLILTGLFWFVLFILNAADAMFVQFREIAALQNEQRTAQIAGMEEGTIRFIRQGRGDETYEPTPEEIAQQNPLLAERRARLEENRAGERKLIFWSDLVFGIKTVLPKTGETVALLERHLIDLDELPAARDDGGVEVDVRSDEDVQMGREEQHAVARRVQEAFRERSLAWVLGTSLAFEAFVLAICCWIFGRRDF